jgi:hypothetical protein
MKSNGKRFLTRLGRDLEMGDSTALFEMLDQLPTRILLGYVAEVEL